MNGGSMVSASASDVVDDGQSINGNSSIAQRYVCVCVCVRITYFLRTMRKLPTNVLRTFYLLGTFAKYSKRFDYFGKIVCVVT